MRIDTYGQQLEVTPALRDYVESKLSRLSRHFDQPIDVRTQLSLERTDHCAEANVNIAGRTLHADADRTEHVRRDRPACRQARSPVDEAQGKDHRLPPRRGRRAQRLTRKRCRSSRCSPPNASSCSIRPGTATACSTPLPACSPMPSPASYAGDRREPAQARAPGQHGDRTRHRHSARPHQRLRPRARRVPALARADRFRRQRRRNPSTSCSRWPCRNISRRSTCSCSRRSPSNSPTPASATPCAPRPTPRRCARCCWTRRTRRPKRCALHDAADLGARIVRPAPATTGPALGRRPARRAARARIGRTPSRAARRWPATSTSSIPTRCRSSAPRNCTGSTALDSRQRWETIEKIMQSRPLALVISKDQRVPRRPARRRARNPTRRCGSRRVAATNCSTTCSTTSRARSRRA